MTFYRALTQIIKPFLRPWLVNRLKTGKEDPERFNERKGFASIKRPEGPLVWIHGASVGESQSALPLVDAFKQKGFSVLITTGTVSSARLLENQLSEKAFHQYVPLDVAPYVERFLNHWNPSIAIILESDFWPLMLGEIKRKKIPLALVNSRLSSQSAKIWSFLSCFGLFSQVRFCAVQSLEAIENLKRAGVKSPVFMGNLKFASPPLSVNEELLEGTLTSFEDRPSWVAASIHPPEISTIIEAHCLLQKDFPSLVTTIVPRHGATVPLLEEALSARGIPFKRRSQCSVIDLQTQVYIGDSLGEMGYYYRLSPIAFVGGTLVPHIGGHNILEPAQLKRAVIHGPFMEKNKEIFRIFQESEGAIVVKDAMELSDHLRVLLQSTEVLDQYSSKAFATAQNQANVIERLLPPLLDMIS